MGSWSSCADILSSSLTGPALFIGTTLFDETTDACIREIQNKSKIQQLGNN